MALNVVSRRQFRPTPIPTAIEGSVISSRFSVLTALLSGKPKSATFSI